LLPIGKVSSAAEFISPSALGPYSESVFLSSGAGKAENILNSKFYIKN